MPDLSGKIIKSYQLGEMIGVGAFAAVYRAHQTVVEREVAIKIIWPALADHPNFIRHFENEAQLVASLEHPYIVPLYDYWREPGGAYIVMRWLRGGHLRDALAYTPWSITDTVRVLDQVAAALALAHRYGVIHCDLKPENILLDEERNAYLADFGIAQLVSKARIGRGEFSSFGSLAYAAPEQLINHTLTPQTDVYSLGVILYEMLAGQHPFPQLAELSEDELRATRSSLRLPSLSAICPDLPPALDHVIQRATALLPQDRYPDTLSMVSAFRDTIGLSRPLDLQKGHSPDALPNPYKGLRAFQEVDANYFFGRDGLVRQLVSRMEEKGRFARFLAIVGPSGSGKSSLVKAGLIPALRRDEIGGNWYFVEMVPGADPFKELESALVSVAVTPPRNLQSLLRRDEMGLFRAIAQVLGEDTQAELFLFIDQFEELYTLSDDSDSFLDSLFTAVTTPNSRLRVAITLRADFYDRPLLHPRISNLMRTRTEVVTPLTPQELEQAIVQPARQVGVLIDSGVVASLITEFNEQPGALPLLQYSLSTLFERREERWITSRAYRDLGGVRGALSRRADELFDSFTRAQQEITRQLFLRLVSLGEGTEDTRRREYLSEILSISTDQAMLQAVITALSDARFLTFDRDPLTRRQTIEVAHEMLIREWGYLRRWLDESRNDVRMQRSIASLASDWLKAGNDLSFLLRGSRLERYLEWAEHTDLILTAQERAFLEASGTERERQQAELKARQQRETALEQQAFNRLRLLVAVLLSATAVALLLAGITLNQSQKARQERNQAESARATSDANAAISHSMALKSSSVQALEKGDADLAVLLALAAAETDRSAPSQRTLAQVAQAPGTRRIFVGHTFSVNGVDISPDNRLIASVSTDAAVRVWNAETGQTLHYLTGHTGDVQSVAFSPNGSMVLSGADDLIAIVWDATTGQEIHRLAGHQGPVRSVAFSPDSTHAFTASTDGLVIEWDVITGREYRRFESHTTSILGLALSPDGQNMVACARDRICVVWDVTSGAEVYRFQAENAVRGLALGPDGEVVFGSTDGTLTLLDWHTGLITQHLSGDHGEIGSIAFDPQGHRVLAGAAGGSLHMWDLVTGTESYRLLGHADAITSVVFSRDGTLVVSGSRDTTLRLWNIQNPAELARFSGANDRITGAAFGADGALITTAIDGKLRVWDAATLRGQIDLGSPVTSLAVSARESVALVGLKDGRVSLIDLDTLQERLSLAGHTDAVLSVVFRADEQIAISGAEDGRVIVWDLATGQPRYELTGHDGAVTGVAISPDGRLAISGGRDHVLIEWDLTTGQELRRLSGHTGSVYSVAISPDGRYALSGGRDGQAILWNLTTGRELTRLVGHTEPIWSVAFDPGGRFAISGAADAVIVWDLLSGTDIQRFAPDGTPFVLAISGHTVTAGEDRGIVQTWQLFTLDELLSWTRTHRYVRDLTCLEQEFYQLETDCTEPEP